MTRLSNNKIKVLVVDDSAFMRRIISDMLKSDASIEVIDTARNGQEGFLKAIAQSPDIITLDIEMPVMDGLTALSEIMKAKPESKVIMLSSHTFEGAEATIKALELGAMDFVPKPSASILNFNADEIKDGLIKKIHQLANSSYHFMPVPKGAERERRKSETKPEDSPGKLKYIIAIGTSTGGPRALQDVIPLLPPDIPAAVLVVQHMPPGFTKSLAARLHSLSHIHVKEAEDGDVLKPGWAYIAPGDYHMLLKKSGFEDYRIAINQSPPVTGHRPSVNVMMSSAAECGHKNIIAVMMTGMGSDGSDGILKIRQMGGRTIAQDESTCVVYGMPKSAVNIGAVENIVPLQNIAKEITKLMGV